jgi:hypothetical protein
MQEKEKTRKRQERERETRDGKMDQMKRPIKQPQQVNGRKK